MALNAATAQVSNFLSDSRLFAEKAKQCKNPNCAYLCTGLTPSHCCRKCAKTPNQHGPKCLKKLLACSSPGCTYAVTGVAASHCCKVCAKGGHGGEEHGPSCWLLPIPTGAKEDEDDDLLDEDGSVLLAAAATATADEPSGSADLQCVPVYDPAVDAAAQPDALDEEISEEERALCARLEAARVANEQALRSNEEYIRMLQEQLVELS